MTRLKALTVPAATLALLVSVVAPAQAAQERGVIAFRASDRGTFTTTPLDAPFVLTEDVATGHGTRLGRYTLHASEVINLATLAVTDGHFTVTAANGDSLAGTYAGAAVGTSDPAVITYHVQGPITGGTGRFDHARGWLVWDGVGNLATGQLADRVSGWINRR